MTNTPPLISKTTVMQFWRDCVLEQLKGGQSKPSEIIRRADILTQAFKETFSDKPNPDTEQT